MVKAKAHMRMGRGLLLGCAAGAAGTAALNVTTYLDMAVRGRPTSTAPEDTVEKLAHIVHTAIPGNDEERSNRLAGLGPLTGLMAGIGVGGLIGLAWPAGGLGRRQASLRPRWAPWLEVTAP